MDSWKYIENVPYDRIVETAIIENGEERMVQPLIYWKNLWWHKDKSTYVYYQPTHWREYYGKQNNFFHR